MTTSGRPVVPLPGDGLVRVLAAVTAALVLAGTAAGIVLRSPVPFVVDSAGRLVLLDAEANLWAWWSSGLLLLAALATAAAAVVDAVPGQARRLALLAGGLLLLSADEAAVVHERATAVVQLLLRGEDASDRPYWIVAALPAGLGALLLLRGLWRALPRDARRGYLGALGLFLGGAVGVELLGNLTTTMGTVSYLLGVAVEEGLECAGALTALATSLRLAGQPSSSPSPRAQDVV